MKVEQKQVTQLTISDATDLDPISVVIEDSAPGHGQIIITCYGRSWTAYWGGMSGDTLAQFFIRVSAGYIVPCLVRGMARTLRSDEKREEAYLLRIVEAVQAALRLQGGAT